MISHSLSFREEIVLMLNKSINFYRAFVSSSTQLRNGLDAKSQGIKCRGVLSQTLCR